MPSRPTPKSAVLLVFSSDESLRSLSRGLAEADARILEARTCGEARQALANDRSIELVITEPSLSDGNWYSVLTSSVVAGDRAALVVAAERPHPRLREEVRSHGGWDVLQTHADPRPLLRAIRKTRTTSQVA